MKKYKIAATICYVAAILSYISAIVNFAGENSRYLGNTIKLRNRLSSKKSWVCFFEKI